MAQEKIQNLNNSITSKEIELWIKKIPSKKNLWPYGLMDIFYKMFNKELIAILYKSSKE